ncbi:helix-turn-helix domain-containing protein [Streptomyces bacillaris]
MGDGGRPLRLVSRVTVRHNLLAGLAGPLPLDEVAAAYADAAVARHSASPARRIVPATAVGASSLAQLLPATPYTGWAATVLSPLTPDHRHLLTVWLRTGSIPCTATALGISAGTVRARLREAGRLLRTDLADAGVRAHLLLALRAPTPAPAPPLRAGRVSLRVLPYGILDTEQARTWAADLLDGLDAHLRIALACWLRHHAKTAPDGGDDPHGSPDAADAPSGSRSPRGRLICTTSSSAGSRRCSNPW